MPSSRPPVLAPPPWLRGGLVALSLTLLAPRPTAAQTQALAVAGGAVGGVVVGLYTTMSIYVAKARAGSYLFSVDEFLEPRIESVPLFLGPAAGAFVGYQSAAALGGAALWAGFGFAGGAALGAGAGELLWGTAEGRWAGAIIGSAAGLLLGATLGARSRWNDGDDEPGGVEAGLSIPVSFDEP
jgi:hypothetical protein